MSDVVCDGAGIHACFIEETDVHVAKVVKTDAWEYLPFFNLFSSCFLLFLTLSRHYVSCSCIRCNMYQVRSKLGGCKGVPVSDVKTKPRCFSSCQQLPNARASFFLLFQTMFLECRQCLRVEGEAPHALCCFGCAEGVTTTCFYNRLLNVQGVTLDVTPS